MKWIMRYSILVLGLLVFCLFTLQNALAQEIQAVDDEEILTIDTPITIDFADEEKEKIGPKKKRRKRKVFYGLKTKKGFTKTGFGNKVIIELFYYLKEYKDPNPYVREIYWYDFKRKAIRNAKKVDREYGVILHGPYKKIQGDQIIEEGIYYIGTKHGRWTKHNKHDILQNKRKFYKGWPRESLVTYYDEGRSKMKEIIPVQHGLKEGNYFYFHENSNIAVSGEFIKDKRVGKWTEYYQKRGRRKKIIQYRTDPYNDRFQPYIWREWNGKGKLIYDRDVEAKRLSGR